MITNHFVDQNREILSTNFLEKELVRLEYKKDIFHSLTVDELQELYSFFVKTLGAIYTDDFSKCLLPWKFWIDKLCIPGNYTLEYMTNIPFYGSTNFSLSDLWNPIGKTLVHINCSYGWIFSYLPGLKNGYGVCETEADLICCKQLENKLNTKTNLTFSLQDYSNLLLELTDNDLIVFTDSDLNLPLGYQRSVSDQNNDWLIEYSKSRRNISFIHMTLNNHPLFDDTWIMFNTENKIENSLKIFFRPIES